MKKSYLLSCETTNSELASLDNSDCQMFPFVLGFLGALKVLKTSELSKFL